mmetsp:Transcript_11059/g.41303  ORF Transcript_11059/g.41303 Transcript_11059/m.41303 type:complete len:432 (-) Transcript_11059:275-1570(-)
MEVVGAAAGEHRVLLSVAAARLEAPVQHRRQAGHKIVALPREECGRRVVRHPHQRALDGNVLAYQRRQQDAEHHDAKGHQQQGSGDLAHEEASEPRKGQVVARRDAETNQVQAAAQDVEHDEGHRDPAMRERNRFFGPGKERVLLEYAPLQVGERIANGNLHDLYLAVPDGVHVLLVRDVPRPQLQVEEPVHRLQLRLEARSFHRRCADALLQCVSEEALTEGLQDEVVVEGRHCVRIVEEEGHLLLGDLRRPLPLQFPQQLPLRAAVQRERSISVPHVRRVAQVLGHHDADDQMQRNDEEERERRGEENRRRSQLGLGRGAAIVSVVVAAVLVAVQLRLVFLAALRVVVEVTAVVLVVGVQRLVHKRLDHHRARDESRELQYAHKPCRRVPRLQAQRVEVLVRLPGSREDSIAEAALFVVDKTLHSAGQT